MISGIVRTPPETVWKRWACFIKRACLVAVGPVAYHKAVVGSEGVADLHVDVAREAVQSLLAAETHGQGTVSPVNYVPDQQIDALEASDLSGVKLMWLNYPHMPTGARARRETFERAVNFGRRHGILIVNDNPYSFILNDKPMSILIISRALSMLALLAAATSM